VSPELFTARRTLKSALPGSIAGDVYAAGCVFYEIYYRLPLVTHDYAVKHPSGPTAAPVSTI
jgi:hypothetical protein